MKSKLIIQGAGTSILVLLLAGTGCNMGSGGGGGSASLPTSTSSSSTQNGSILVKDVSMSILNANGSTVFDSQNSNSSLVLTAGTQYQLLIQAPGAPTGTTFMLQMSPFTAQSTPVTTSIPLVVGKNNLQVSGSGTYVFELSVSTPGVVATPRSYTAQVNCVEPNGAFTTVNGSAITVTGSQNIYTYSAVGVTNNSNGVAPYQCAWDLTGVNIQDTAFGSCSTPLSGQYSNYVGTRDVSVMVMDACGQTVTASNSVNLAYTEPTFPGNVFIYGQVSNATGSAASDPRINNVTYLATNVQGNNIVKVNYGNGSFTINAQEKYQTASSLPFGMSISLTGINSSINLSAGTGTVDVSGASIKSVTYTTDQSGDALPAQSLTSTSCTLSNQGANVKLIAGSPCSGGTSGNTNAASVEVYGDYQCNMSGGSGTATITGRFDGYYRMADNCSGGGGGGGGVAPIGL